MCHPSDAGDGTHACIRVPARRCPGKAGCMHCDECFSPRLHGEACGCQHAAVVILVSLRRIRCPAAQPLQAREQRKVRSPSRAPRQCARESRGWQRAHHLPTNVKQSVIRTCALGEPVCIGSAFSVFSCCQSPQSAGGWLASQCPADLQMQAHLRMQASRLCAAAALQQT